MRHANNFSMEKMRYAAPKVCNRFWRVHLWVILLCALVAALVTTVTLSAVIIGRVQKLEPKPSLVFFCEVDDIDVVRDGISKYTSVLDIYFAEYGDEDYPSPDTVKIESQTLLCVYDKRGLPKHTFTYRLEGLEAGAVLGVADIERLIIAAEGIL